MVDTVTEDSLEVRAMDEFKSLGYNLIDAYTPNREDLKDSTGRTNKDQVVLSQVLIQSLKEINPHIPGEIIHDEAKAIIEDASLNSKLFTHQIFLLVFLSVILHPVIPAIFFLILLFEMFLPIFFLIYLSMILFLVFLLTLLLRIFLPVSLLL